MRSYKKIIAFIIMLALLLNSVVFAAPAKKTAFKDLNNHWSRSMVERLVDYGIASGYKDKTFHPDDFVNADEFIKLVILSLGYNIDNSEGYWAWGYISKASELGMIDEYEFERYDTPITRAQAAKIIAASLKSTSDADLSPLKAKIYDYAEIPEQYKASVLISYNARIITGYENDSFLPLNNVTRAEAATIIIRLIDKNGGVSSVQQPGTVIGGGGQSAIVSSSLYVDNNGSDSNDGSEGSPFKSIQKAKDTVRAMVEAGKLPSGGVNVYLREGTYYMTDSLEFGIEDSGFDNGKITYTSYPGESVRLTGGKPIDKSWFKPIDSEAKSRIIDKNAASKVLVADLKSNGITEYGVLNTRGYHYFNKGQYMAAELIVNGENQTLARYPNKGTITVKNENLLPDDLSFKYDNERPSSWAKAKDVWICGTLSINYENNYYPIDKIDTSAKTIKLREGKIRTYYTNGWYFADNLLEEIDQVGEYYIDREAGKLYYMPPENFGTGNHTIELSTIGKPIFYFNGAKNISITNMVIEGGRGYAALGTTKDYKMMTYGDFLVKNNVKNPAVFDTTSKNATKMSDPKNYPEAQVFPGHMWDGFLDDGEGVTGIEFKNCEIRNFGQGGLIFRGTNVKLEGNHIKNIGGTGIFLTGGDLEKLTPSGNTIVGNNIHRIGYQHRAYNPGIAVQGVGCRVAYNDLYDAPHCVLNYHGNDHVFEYNKIHDAVKECLDMDAIYTRNEYIPQWRGSVIRNNYIYNLGIFPVGEYTQQLNISAIRTDNSGHALQIYNNIFANIGTAGANSVIGITAQGNRNMIKGNLFVDCSTTYRGADTYNAGATWKDDEETKKRLELVKKYAANPIFIAKYPELATFDKEFYQAVATNTFDENLVVNIKFKLSETNGMPNSNSTRGAPELIVGKNNIITTSDPGFINYSEGNYELPSGLDVFTKMPLYKNFKMSEFGPQAAVGPIK